MHQLNLDHFYTPAHGAAELEEAALPAVGDATS